MSSWLIENPTAIQSAFNNHWNHNHPGLGALTPTQRNDRDSGCLHKVVCTWVAGITADMVEAPGLLGHKTGMIEIYKAVTFS
jgi:hypothetical protein